MLFRYNINILNNKYFNIINISINKYFNSHVKSIDEYKETKTCKSYAAEQIALGFLLQKSGSHLDLQWSATGVIAVEARR